MELTTCTKIVLIIAILYLLYQRYDRFTVKTDGHNYHKEFNYAGEYGIPKVIHQQGPSSMNDWHENWKFSRKSWLNLFPEPEYKHILWTNDMIREMIATDYPWFLKRYDSLPRDIMRYDASRFFMLHKYGGIYADLDYEVLKNFYDALPQDRISLVESACKWNENLQNSLMISPRGNEFWIAMARDVMDANITNDVLGGTGPRRLDRNHKMTTLPINILPHQIYNPLQKYSPFDGRVRLHAYDPKVNTVGFDDTEHLVGRHHVTTTWAPHLKSWKSRKTELEM